MIKIFSKYPRELAHNKRYGVFNIEEVIDIVNKYNGKTNIFISIYGFDKMNKVSKYGKEFYLGDYDTADVNIAFFDFANDNCYSNIIKAHKWLKSEKIKHRINFSGRKYHLYIFVKNSDKLKYKKDALYNLQVWVCDELNFTYGKEDHREKDNPDIDSKLMGNLSGLTRISNTFNPAGRRYCISLNEKTLYSGEENINELAKEQQYLKGTLFEGKCLDLLKFDKQRIDIFNEETNYGADIPQLKGKVEIGKEHFYPCVYKMITEGGYENTFFCAIWLKDKGFSYKEADVIFKKYLSGKHRRTFGYGDDYNHARLHDKALESVYADKDGKYLLPRCGTIFQNHMCPGRCENFEKHYFSRKKKMEVTENDKI